jgi:hypothetical protein
MADEPSPKPDDQVPSDPPPKPKWRRPRIDFTSIADHTGAGPVILTEAPTTPSAHS